MALLKIIAISSVQTAEKKIHIFGESHIDEIAAELEVPVLGRMPLDAALAEVVEKEAFYEAENPYLEVEAL